MKIRNYVKLILLSFFSIIFTFPAYASDTLINSLSQSVNNTFFSDFAIEESNVFSFSTNQNRIFFGQLNVASKRQNDNLDMNSDLDVNFDFSSLAEYDELLNLIGNFKVKEDIYFNKSTTDFFWRAGDLNLTFSEDSNQRATVIALGYLEFFKFFTERFIQLNMQEFGEFINYVNEAETDLSFDVGSSILKLYYNENNIAVELFKSILKSGFFDISKNGNTFLVTLAKNLDDVDMSEFIDTLGEFLNISEIERGLILEDLERELLSLQSEEWQELLNILKFELRINTSSGKVIGHKLDLLINVEDGFTDISFALNGSSIITSDSVGNITWPLELKKSINITKFFNAVKTIMEIEREKWSQWDQSAEYDYEYDEQYY